MASAMRNNVSGNLILSENYVSQTANGQSNGVVSTGQSESKRRRIESESDDNDPIVPQKVRLKVESSDTPTKNTPNQISHVKSETKPVDRNNVVKKESLTPAKSTTNTPRKPDIKPKIEVNSAPPKRPASKQPSTPARQTSQKTTRRSAPVKNQTKSPKKPKVEEPEVWSWWEELDSKDDGIKWKTLEHKGPYFAPPYERMPSSVKFYYDGKSMKLSDDAEEVASFYAKMLEHEYTTKPMFNKNFFHDWRSVMNKDERAIIKDLKLCNFKPMHDHFKMKSEERKALPKEAKKKLKEEADKLTMEYGFCTIDGHKQKLGNFRIEPPGLFRGRGEHPKMGKLKRRTMPEDVIINCGKNSVIPKAPPGHKWKEVRHDNTVTWLCNWTENIQGSGKYVMLNAASKLKGEKDWLKYETARRLHREVDRIRKGYQADLKSREMRFRQRAVALYLIDKLALRAGNEKDEDAADTVGCCSLRFEHIKLLTENDQFLVEFDFLGKDSIRYYNKVGVDKQVFKNLKLFMEGKRKGDDLFDRLTTPQLNKHLQDQMDGLTAKVFRTYNASLTLQQQLNKLTNPNDPIPAKLLAYNRANREVAILCNHQRAVPKNFQQQMEKMQDKIKEKNTALKEAKKQVKQAKADFKSSKNVKTKKNYELKKKALERTQQQLQKLELQATDKDENKDIALGTSKLNYLDPRISVAWSKKHGVPIEKIYSKTHRAKFQWAIDMTDESYDFGHLTEKEQKRINIVQGRVKAEAGRNKGGSGGGGGGGRPWEEEEGRV